MPLLIVAAASRLNIPFSVSDIVMNILRNYDRLIENLKKKYMIVLPEQYRLYMQILNVTQDF